jgi:hypothetical protein
MHRLTATLLLLFALGGNLVPLALAATADPPHACCVRKQAHPCHGSALTESEELTIRAAACCHQECCRAISTARWAYARPRLTVFSTQIVEAHAVALRAHPPSTTLAPFRSTRAPPHSFILIA